MISDTASRGCPETKVIIWGPQCSTMSFDFEELYFLFAAGAAIIIALCLYNKFGKVKEE